MRARNIKPGFYKNADLSECSIWARFLAPGLWMLADREGRLEDRPKQIKGEIFPYDDVNVNALLEELATYNHITRYEVDGKRYIQVLNFKEHQRCHNNEAESQIPEPLVSKQKITSHHGRKCLQPSKKPLRPSLLNAECGMLNAETLPNGNYARAPDDPRKTSLEILSVDQNAVWLAKKRSEGRYLDHDEHFVLEQFKQYCKAKGKKYADYLAGYRNAFEWDKCQPKPPSAGNAKQSGWITEGRRLAAKYAAEAQLEQARALVDSIPDLRSAEAIREDTSGTGNVGGRVLLGAQ